MNLVISLDLDLNLSLDASGQGMAEQSRAEQADGCMPYPCSARYMPSSGLALAQLADLAG